jgi:hypothetical protein
VGATEFDELLVQAKAALNAIVNGDPSGYKTIYSEGEDITLGNPFDPRVGRQTAESVIQR